MIANLLGILAEHFVRVLRHLKVSLSDLGKQATLQLDLDLIGCKLSKSN